MEKKAKKTLHVKEIEEEETKKNTFNDALNQQSSFKIYELIIFAVLLVACSAFLTVMIVGNKDNTSSKTSYNYSSDENLKDFEEVYGLINSSYYKKVNKKKLIEGAINGMISSLDDKHTNYFNAEETESFNEMMKGSYEGIGAEISLDDNKNIVIVSI